MIRVLVADDSATTRALLARLLSADGLIQVVGQAKNGQQAYEMTKELKPDVITMDIIMPILDGVAATAKIMENCPTPIIIVSSLEDVRRSKISMDALNNGAIAILALPNNNDRDLSALTSHLRETVLVAAKVKSTRLGPGRSDRTDRTVNRLPVSAHPVTSPQSLDKLLATHPPCQIISIACSVGGPAALAQILAELPGDLPVPILVTQHISRGFTVDLAAWLNQRTDLTVTVARDCDALKGGTVFIAPDDFHLGVRNRIYTHVSNASPVKGFRPAATFMFESVAKVFKRSSVAAILTGMGDDGVAGLKFQKEQGAIIIAQDEDSSVVYGMPKAAINNGLADLILPLNSIGETLKTIARGTQ